MSAIKDRNTLVPANDDADSITQLYTLLTQDRGAGQDLLVSLAAPSDNNSFAMMPSGMADLFVSMVTALHAGQPITVVPQNATFTTQEAADVLGMSRPTVIKLIDAGELSCERVGTHRRIPVRDVLALRDQRRAAVQNMLATSAVEDEVGTPDEIRAAVRAARKSIAIRRRGE